MVFHRGLGVRDGDVIEQRVATVTGSPEEQVQVHHVVHDGVVTTEHLHVAGPAEDRADERAEECGERVGCVEQCLAVKSIMVQLIALAERAKDNESQVVVIDRPIDA